MDGRDATCDVSEAARQERQPAVAERKIEIGEAIREVADEALREFALMVGQNVDRELAPVLDGLAGGASPLRADQEHAGVQRDRREGVHRHAVIPALPQSGHDSHACRERPNHLPEMQWIDRQCFGSQTLDGSRS
jgi:hypothetical protein